MLLVTSPVDIKMFEKMIGLVFISLYTANKKLATDRRREPESSAGLVHFHSKHVYCPPNRKVYPVVLAPLLSQKKKLTFAFLQVAVEANKDRVSD